MQYINQIAPFYLKGTLDHIPSYKFQENLGMYNEILKYEGFRIFQKCFGFSGVIGGVGTLIDVTEVNLAILVR